MKKLLTSAILVLTLIVSLSSCGLFSSYEVFEYDNSNSDIYNYEGNKYALTKLTSYLADGKKSKTITFCGKEYSMKYTESGREEFFIHDFDSYTCKENSNITFRFDQVTNKLIGAYIPPQVGEYFAEVEGEITAESCTALVRSIFADYYENNPNEYTESCSIPGEGAEGNIKVTCTRRIDGHDTLDSFEVLMTKEGKVFSVKISMQDAYEDYYKLSIDEEKVNKLIEDKMKSLCNKDGNTMSSCSVENAVLVIGNDDELLVFATVIPTIKDTNGNKLPNVGAAKLFVKIK